MITHQENQELLQAHGQLRDQPGWAEEMVAAGEVLQLVGQLYQAMQTAGMTQADLARAMGVHRRQILRWFRGDGAIAAETLIAMGRHIGVRLQANWVPLEQVDRNRHPQQDAPQLPDDCNQPSD